MAATKNVLLDEAQKIVRPALELRDAKRRGKDVVGVWGGPELVPLGKVAGTFRHVLSVDASWFAENGLGPGGTLSVYRSEDSTGRGAAALDEKLVFRPSREGTPLEGRAVNSLPPLPALCLYGGPPIEEWVRGLGYTRDDHDHPDVYETPWALDYQEHYQGGCHLFLQDYAVAAVLGGWHMLWPDDDAYDQRKSSKLLVWTFRDSEPWLEVWRGSRGELEVLERIT